MTLTPVPQIVGLTEGSRGNLGNLGGKELWLKPSACLGPSPLCPFTGEGGLNYAWGRKKVSLRGILLARLEAEMISRSVPLI